MKQVAGRQKNNRHRFIEMTISCYANKLLFTLKIFSYYRFFILYISYSIWCWLDKNRIKLKSVIIGSLPFICLNAWILKKMMRMEAHEIQNEVNNEKLLCLKDKQKLIKNFPLNFYIHFMPQQLYNFFSSFIY